MREPFVRSILHPTDFSQASHTAFAHALAIVLYRQARLRILHVARDEDDVVAAAVARSQAEGTLAEPLGPLVVAQTRSPALLAPRFCSPRDAAQWIEADLLSDMDALLERVAPTEIVHCAALSRAADCERDPALARRTNEELPGALAAWAAGHGARLVHVSTDLVFGATDAPAGVPMTCSPASTVYTLIDLVWATFWTRFPTLKFSLTEGDIGWIPFFLWRAEHVKRRHGGWTKHDFSQTGGPSQIFRDHILCCFIEDDTWIPNLEAFNLDHICWESDFPHSDGTWPHAPERIVETLAGLDEALIHKITHENAMKIYGFDPFATRERERCTAGALRAESPDVDVVTRVGRLSSDRDLEAWRELTSGRGR